MGRPCALGPITKSAIRTKRCRERQKQREFEQLDALEEMSELVNEMKMQIAALEDQNLLLKDFVKTLKDSLELRVRSDQSNATKERKEREDPVASADRKRQEFESIQRKETPVLRKNPFGIFQVGRPVYVVFGSNGI